MRCPAALLASLSLLMLALVSRAQAPSSQQATSNPAAQPRVFRMSPDWLATVETQARYCPVNLDVRHGAGLGQMIAADGFTRTPTAQALDVTITNLGDREIVSVDVVVQLRSGKSRVMPLVRDEDELGERLPLHFDMSVKVEAAASWGIASRQSVAYVEISKVTYRDGSSWSASKGSVCQFKPNPMMLISSR